jgi:hypothetical protein
MPKLSCPCGFVHNLSPIPDAGWRTIPDRRYEEFLAAQVLRHQIAGDNMPPPRHPRGAEYRAASEFVVASIGLLYRCPECGRIMWRREGNDSDTWEIFVPEIPGNGKG